MKLLRRLLSLALAALLAGTPVYAAPLQGATSPTTPVTLVAAECVAANSSPIVEAILEPGAAVSSARVYYKTALTTNFSVVEMERRGDRLEACLPQPRPDAGTVTYYVVTTSGAGAPEQRTGEVRAVVVSNPGACGGRRMASDCSDRLVSAAQPPGPVEVTAGASRGGGGISKGIIIASSAALVGVGVYLLVRDKEPKSPSR